MLSGRVVHFPRPMQLELTVGGGWQGLGEGWEKLYKRLPDLPA
jgi:hypothetical protein